MGQTWFEQHREQRAVTQKKQQEHLTAVQTERYGQEVRGEMEDLVQVRRRERQREAENGGFVEVTEDHAMEDQDIKWPKGSHKHPFQRIADLAWKIAGRNNILRHRLFRLCAEEAEKGVCAAAIYQAFWEIINNLADDVLDEAIGVVYDEPAPERADERVAESKTKTATAA